LIFYPKYDIIFIEKGKRIKSLKKGLIKMTLMGCLIATGFIYALALYFFGGAPPKNP